MAKKYNRRQIREMEERFRNLISPHLQNFQNIIKSVISNYPNLSKYYTIDDNPNISISDKDLTIGCSLTFSNHWDTSPDECSTEIIDTSIIDKIFAMESKIIKNLDQYCKDNRLKIKFINNSSSWDDAGIFCSIDIGFLPDIGYESSIFKDIRFI